MEGRAGYRAHFWSGKEQGLRFNERVIDRLRDRLGAERSSVFRGRELNSEFEACEEAEFPKEFVRASLDPYLSKVWFCTKRFEGTGEIAEIMPSVTRPKIALQNGKRWTTLYAESDDVAWLDIKGAFLGQSGPYQPKCPVKRASGLHEDGST